MSNITVTTPNLPARQLPADEIGNAALSTLDRATILVYPAAQKVHERLVEIDGRPLGDKVFVLPLPPSQRFGSIIIPDNSKDENHCGIVVMVGRGRVVNGNIIPPEVSVGNYVTYNKYSGRDVQLGDVTLKQISECDIVFAVGRYGAPEESQQK